MGRQALTPTGPGWERGAEGRRPGGPGRLVRGAWRSPAAAPGFSGAAPRGSGAARARLFRSGARSQGQRGRSRSWPGPRVGSREGRGLPLRLLGGGAPAPAPCSASREQRRGEDRGGQGQPAADPAHPRTWQPVVTGPAAAWWGGRRPVRGGRCGPLPPPTALHIPQRRKGGMSPALPLPAPSSRIASSAPELQQGRLKRDSGEMAWSRRTRHRHCPGALQTPSVQVLGPGTAPGPLRRGRGPGPGAGWQAGRPRPALLLALPSARLFPGCGVSNSGSWDESSPFPPPGLLFGLLRPRPRWPASRPRAAPPLHSSRPGLQRRGPPGLWPDCCEAGGPQHSQGCV